LALFWLPGRRRLYIQEPPLEPFFSSFPSQATAVAVRCLLRIRKIRKVPHFKRFLTYLSVPFLPTTCLLARRRALSGLQGQRGDPPHHASKQSPRQAALGQQQPVICHDESHPRNSFPKRNSAIVPERCDLRKGVQHRRMTVMLDERIRISQLLREVR